MEANWKEANFPHFYPEPSLDEVREKDAEVIFSKHADKLLFTKPKMQTSEIHWTPLELRKQQTRKQESVERVKLISGMAETVGGNYDKAGKMLKQKRDHGIRDL